MWTPGISARVQGVRCIVEVGTTSETTDADMIAYENFQNELLQALEKRDLVVFDVDDHDEYATFTISLERRDGVLLRAQAVQQIFEDTATSTSVKGEGRDSAHSSHAPN